LISDRCLAINEFTVLFLAAGMASPRRLGQCP
jgi:hypothetical protein